MVATYTEPVDFQARALERVAELPPGPELAIALDDIDPGRLSAEHCITVLTAEQRMINHYQARAYASMRAVLAAYEDIYDAEAHRAASMEIAPALRLSRRSADTEVDVAHRLEGLPAVADLLADGRLDRRRVISVVRGIEHLDPAASHRVVDDIVPDLPDLTAGQITARLRRRCLDVDPDTARDRYEAAVAMRRVITEMRPDGTIDLLALDLPADAAAAASDTIHRLAMNLKRAGDDRPIDQLRADVLLDLLTSDDRRSDRPGTVDLTVSLETLAGLDDAAGDLNGYGPVLADIARQVADRQHGANWRFRVVDDDGCLHDVGATRRRPTVDQARWVQARDGRCVFPGCRMPARHADIDHITPHADHGPTCPCNLASLCRYHHTGRHRFGWTYRATGHGGHEWMSPLGRTYTSGGRSP